MDQIIAYCGLTCSGCPAYVATKSGDEAKVRDVAAKWSKQWNVDLKPKDVLCDGCLETDGKHVRYWDTCEIRICSAGKGLVNCAHCDDYVCPKLKKWFSNAPEARMTLDRIRESLAG